MKTKLPLLLLGLALLPATAAAQSFNIDLDSEFSPPELGGGTPSSAFGAAANSPGFWNKIPAEGMVPTQLRDLAGQMTGVIMTGPSGGVGGGNNFAANIGDYRALMNDGRLVGSDTWTFSGLAKGRYRVFTYAVWPSELVTSSAITVAGSITSNPQIVTGPMPPNQFIQVQTHAIHDILVTNGTLSIHVDEGIEDAFVNGFQLVRLRSRS